jgi:hypothetical protein
MKKIEVISCASGDWEVLVVDGKIYYEGHEIPDDVWLLVLKDLGCTTKTREISDRAMEYRTFEKKLK